MIKKRPRKAKMGEIDYGIFLTVMVLLAIGIVMVYSASSYSAMIKDGDSMLFLKKELVWGIVGTVAMCFTMSVDYHKIKKITPIIVGISIVSLVAVLFFPPINGARRWIPLPGMSFQPSELGKYAVVLALAMNIERIGERIRDIYKGIFPFLIFSGVFAALVLLGSNLSIASVIMIVTFIMLFSAGGQYKHLFGVVAPGLFAAAAAFAILEPYRLRRLMSFTDPWKDAAGDGYQLIQSFYALGAGGVTGLGLGQSRQKTMYMPEPHNDFIFAIIGEELGLIGCLVIMALFLILIWRGVKVATKARDTYGMLLAIGITSIIAVQCLINIAVVTGSMPVTGVPLPFISYGGTSLVINLTAMGILLNISRQSEKKEVS
ncbi:MAG: stage V sporulation protein E [Clostridium sp.]